MSRKIEVGTRVVLRRPQNQYSGAGRVRQIAKDYGCALYGVALDNGRFWWVAPSDVLAVEPTDRFMVSRWDGTGYVPVAVGLEVSDLTPFTRHGIQIAYDNG